MYVLWYFKYGNTCYFIQEISMITARDARDSKGRTTLFGFFRFEAPSHNLVELTSDPRCVWDTKIKTTKTRLIHLLSSDRYSLLARHLEKSGVPLLELVWYGYSDGIYAINTKHMRYRYYKRLNTVYQKHK